MSLCQIDRRLEAQVLAKRKKDAFYQATLPNHEVVRAELAGFQRPKTCLCEGLEKFRHLSLRIPCVPKYTLKNPDLMELEDSCSKKQLRISCLRLKQCFSRCKRNLCLAKHRFASPGHIWNERGLEGTRKCLLYRFPYKTCWYKREIKHVSTQSKETNFISRKK